MKTVAVIGLGKFGFYIAKSLSRLNITVIAVDNDEQKVQEISEFIDNAFVIDSTNKQALEEIGIYNLNTVIVSIGENIEASILTVMALKDLGNKNIIAKSITSIHGEILSKIGAFKVVSPEKIAGRILVKQLIDNIIVEEIDVSNSIKMVKLLVNENLISKRIEEVEADYPDIKIISYKSDNCWHIKVNPEYRIKQNDMIVLLGEAKHIEHIFKTIC